MIKNNGLKLFGNQVDWNLCAWPNLKQALGILALLWQVEMRMLLKIFYATKTDFTKIILLIGISAMAFAESDSSRVKARDLYSRVTGVKLPLSHAQIGQMATLIEAGDTINAARIATQSLDFYNVNLYQFFAPKSVRSESKDTPLNDFIAMGIANTAMGLPYSDLLTKNFTVEFKAIPPKAALALLKSL